MQSTALTPVISLGAGVQSSALLLMATHGEFEVMPELAIFADTGAEPGDVYKWLDWLGRQVSIPVARVSAGNLSDDLVAAARGERPRASNPPLFTATGMIPRGCTRDYKLRVMDRELRRRGFGPKRPVERWLGISLDEVERMKPSGVKWQSNRWPLIERRLTREGCKRWLADHGYPEPPRSACTFCPFHSDAEWRRLRDHDPEGWREAVAVDAAIRRGLPGLREEAFLHRQRVPLPMVDLSTPEDRGQGSFDAECEGMCGV